MEAPFDKLDGVISTTSGYTGGSTPEPTYEQVSAGGTGHAEAVQVVYDPAKVSYEKLLDVFWRNVDPDGQDRQFCDVGSPVSQRHLRPRRRSSERSPRRRRTPLEALGPSRTPGRHGDRRRRVRSIPPRSITRTTTRRIPSATRYYRRGCGRDARLRELWGSEAPSAH